MTGDSAAVGRTGPSPNFLEIVASVLTGAVILGFTVLFVIDIIKTWQGTLPTYSTGWVYTMTGVSAAVGGLVAVFLGQSPQKVTKKDDLGINLPGNLRASKKLRPIFASALLAAWVILGIGAVVTWIFQSNISDLLHNFAVTWLGLVIPFVVAWLGGSEQAGT